MLRVEVADAWLLFMRPEAATVDLVFVRRPPITGGR
jgi:hypothetical protein